MADEMNGERESFEAWYHTTNWPGDLGQHEGRYMSNIADASWQAWLARASLAASAGSEPVAPEDYVPMLDDEGRMMVGTSHHYTAENIRALVEEYKALEAGAPEALERYSNSDHRTRAGVLWRVISALADEVPFTHPSPPEGMAGWRPIESFSEDEADELIAWKPGLGRVIVTWLPDGHPDADEGEGWHEAWSHKRVRGITHARIPPAPPIPASEAKEL